MHSYIRTHNHGFMHTLYKHSQLVMNTHIHPYTRVEQAVVGILQYFGTMSHVSEDAEREFNENIRQFSSWSVVVNGRTP